MKLFLTKGWTASQELVSEIASEEDISGLLNSLDWLDFNSVTLEKDSKNWMGVSGNLVRDGLAIVFEENGVQHVSDNAPKTIEELEKALKLFLKNDPEFKRYGFVSSQKAEVSTSETGHELWKVRFEALEKSEKRRHWFNVVVAILIVTGLGSILPLWFIDELKFLGRKTDHATAVVTEVTSRYLKGGFVNVVGYEFDFSDSVYVGHFWETATTGSYQKGDVIRIKFAVNNPSRSKRLGRLGSKSSLRTED